MSSDNLLIVFLVFAGIIIIYVLSKRLVFRTNRDNSEDKGEDNLDIHENFKGEYFGINIEQFKDIEHFLSEKIEKQKEGSEYFTNSEMEITLHNNCNIHILNEDDKFLLVAYFDPELFSQNLLKTFRGYLEENEFINNDDDRFDDEQVQIYQKLFGFTDSNELLDEMIDIFNYLNSEPYDPEINYSLLFGELKSSKANV